MLERRHNLGDLLRAANRGDAAAYRRLLEQLTPWLNAVARRRLARAGRGPEDSEDIVQEVLLAVHLKRHTWREDQPLEPWLKAIAHHKTVDALRRRGFRDHLPIEDCDMHESLAVEAEGPSSSRFADLLGMLPERHRAIVQGISVEGRSAAEVGKALGLGEGAVRVTLHRALKRLAYHVKRGDA